MICHILIRKCGHYDVVPEPLQGRERNSDCNLRNLSSCAKTTVSRCCVEMSETIVLRVFCCFFFLVVCFSKVMVEKT